MQGQRSQHVGDHTSGQCSRMELHACCVSNECLGREQSGYGWWGKLAWWKVGSASEGLLPVVREHMASSTCSSSNDESTVQYAFVQQFHRIVWAFSTTHFGRLTSPHHSRFVRHADAFPRIMLSILELIYSNVHVSTDCDVLPSSIFRRDAMRLMGSMNTDLLTLEVIPCVTFMHATSFEKSQHHGKSGGG